MLELPQQAQSVSYGRISGCLLVGVVSGRSGRRIVFRQPVALASRTRHLSALRNYADSRQKEP